jgi:hypothetical protein
MPHKIFISHNHLDKPIVEPIALKLSNIFGPEQVFYDSWSIRPGDGIIDKMNEGLDAPEFVFFFVSRKSITSEMVKLEWQNALHLATRAKTRLIPVRIDQVDMPAILRQTLYIDLFSIGLEAGIAQIVSVTQGNSSFVSNYPFFSNLSFDKELTGDNILNIIIRASHFLEPNPSFLILVGNNKEEIEWSAIGAPGWYGDFHDEIKLDNGSLHRGITIKPMGATLTPAFPVRLQLIRKSEPIIDFHGILHQQSETNWISIPEKSARC